MQFIPASAALFAAIAAAAPTPVQESATLTTRQYASENIDINDFFVRKNNGIQAVSFKLSGDDAKDLECSGSNPKPTDVITCGDSKYRFVIKPGQVEEFGLTIYHELGPAFGFYGEGDVPTYCHAGGNGPDDFVCQQVAFTTIVIDNGADPSS